MSLSEAVVAVLQEDADHARGCQGQLSSGGEDLVELRPCSNWGLRNSDTRTWRRLRIPHGPTSVPGVGTPIGSSLASMNGHMGLAVQVRKCRVTRLQGLAVQVRKYLLACGGRRCKAANTRESPTGAGGGSPQIPTRPRGPAVQGRKFP